MLQPLERRVGVVALPLRLEESEHLSRLRGGRGVGTLVQLSVVMDAVSAPA